MTDSRSKDPENKTAPKFVQVAQSVEGSGHAVGITVDGVAYSWSSRGSNPMGALGRDVAKARPAGDPHPVNFEKEPPSIHRAFAGGSNESGHSVLLDSNKQTLWVSGCDRWQQLGLGSASGGAAGYTWEGGRIWRNSFVRNDFVIERMRQDDNDATIRDVALGGDHTLVLSSNQRDVYAFGKGGEGQLGTTGKPFVSAPVKATKLSVSSNDNKTKIAAVCAIQHCALTIDDKGDVLKHAGKCRRSSREFQEALEACIRRATSNGLLSSR